MKYKLYLAFTECTRDYVVEADSLEDAKGIMLQNWHSGQLVTGEGYEEVEESDEPIKDTDSVELTYPYDENSLID